VKCVVAISWLYFLEHNFKFFMDKWVIKLSGGMIESQKQAEAALLIFVVIVMGVSFFLFFSKLNREENKPAINQNSYAPLHRPKIMSPR